MHDIHQETSSQTIKTLLQRIQGQPYTGSYVGSRPVYSEPVPEPNRDLLLAFHQSLATEDVSVGRIAVLLGNMYRVSIWIDHKPFPELTRGDVVDLVAQLKRKWTRSNPKGRRGYAPQTVEGYKSAIKKFWRWMRNRETGPDVLSNLPYPPEVSWMRTKKIRNRLLPQEVWTPEEVNRVAGCAGNERDRAFILGLFGSGCRIGEFLPLQRDQVEFDQYSAQVLVSGKTGPRRVRLTPAASVALAGWLDVHPNKAPDAAIWVNIQARRYVPTSHLSYAWARKMILELAQRAGVTKRSNPHLMRHSLATYYAPRLTEAVMNEHFGWRQGGKTAAIYTHLSGKQVDDQLLAAFGKKRIDRVSNEAVDVRACHRCGLENPPTATQCSKCGFPMTEKAAHELHDRRERADDLMNSLLSNPEVAAVIRKVVGERRGERPEASPPEDAPS